MNDDPKRAAPLQVAPAPQLQGLAAYSAAPVKTLLDLPLGGTERAVSSPEIVRLAHEVHGEQLCRYPQPRALEKFIAQRFDIDPRSVLVTAGADEALDRALRAVLAPGRNVVAPEPTFEMIDHYARLSGADTRHVPWLEGPYPTDDILAAVDGSTAAIVIVSPNNPTGAVATARDLERLAESAPQALIVVDLAYIEYADVDLTQTVLGLPNAVATRTLSKAWGLPGARVGFALGDPRVVAWMRAAGGPYSVGAMALAVARRRLQTGDDEVKAYAARVRDERAALTRVIEELSGSAGASQSNFVLARLPEPEWVREALAGLGIGVRTFPTQPLLTGAMRISCPGDATAYQRLVHALRCAIVPQALLFDLDGVLADVSGSYRRAIIDTAHELGAVVTPADIAAQKAAGDANNDWVVTHRLVTAAGVTARLEEVTERFERLYQGTEDEPGLRRTERLMPTRDLLEALRRRLPLAVVTGRPRRDAEIFLRSTGIADLFDALVCMEDGPPKPDPHPVRRGLEQLGVSRAWMVGDTPDDVRAARAAGVVPLGIVAPGEDVSAATQTLLGAGAARVLAQLDDLLTLLQRLEPHP